tara:strand:- start:3 stop:818 length:816 start_codon:yes stop_codon:yes gene_type:complete
MNSTGGAINIGEGAHTGAINVGTGSSARTITLGNAASTSLNANAKIVNINASTGGTGINMQVGGFNKLSIANDGKVTAANDMILSSSTTSTTSTTGALTVTGGVGITQNANIGGTLSVTGKVTIAGAADAATTTLNLEVNGQVKANQFNAISDARFKTNIQHVTDSLSIINQLNGMSFTWIGDDTNKQVFGLIAQEVEKVLPEIVNTSTTENEQGFNPKSIHYDGLFPHLIESVKTLSKENETLKTKVNTLESTVNSLESKLEMIMKHLNL